MAMSSLLDEMYVNTILVLVVVTCVGGPILSGAFRPPRPQRRKGSNAGALSSGSSARCRPGDDRESHVGKLDRLDEAQANGWTVQSMKDDSATSFRRETEIVLVPPPSSVSLTEEAKKNEGTCRLAVFARFCSEPKPATIPPAKCRRRPREI